MKKFVFASLLAICLASCQKADVAEPGALVPLTVAEDATLPSLPVNGTLLHVETFGNPTDPMIVMVHGGPGGDYRSLLKAKAFAGNGFFVVFYDQRSTGLSKREPRAQFESPGAIQMMIDDLDAVIDHFRIDENQKVFLIGHSWGAMLSTAYINQHPEQITGAVLAEPGGFTWPQTMDYLSRSNHVRLFNEALNDALFPEQIFAGRSEDEVLDYKAAYFTTFENAPGNTLGNAGPYPFWRSGAVSFQALIENADKNGFDFTTHLSDYSTKIFFAYSELNRAYGRSWAEKVSAPYPNVELVEIKGTGHELLYFGWDDFYAKTLPYLNELK